MQGELPHVSDAIQDYLKAIFTLGSEGERVTTSLLATRMGVTAPSATAMLKRLAALGLVEHVRYRGVLLTEAGERIALEVIRHHRLLERYLAEALGLPLEALHAEADRLEHSLSEELEARIDELLGYPTHDPHGHPIPDSDLKFDRSEPRTLADLEPGDGATVRQVPDDDPELLRYLASLSLVPGTRLELRGVAPFGGPLTVRVDGDEHAVSRELAAAIGVA
ncbi:MAG: metal-dependent transcriptional regulator [Actinomycetota bacterium]|nr:metal-dependent transcriptional regulator [Actinomycetota bacterium]